MERVGVAFVVELTVLRGNRVFVSVILFDAGNESRPHAPVVAVHHVAGAVPVIELAHNADFDSIGREDTEKIAGLPVLLARVGTHKLPCTAVLPGMEELLMFFQRPSHLIFFHLFHSSILHKSVLFLQFSAALGIFFVNIAKYSQLSAQSY